MFETTVSPASAVHIGRINVSCLVPRNHPTPDLVGSRLETIATRELAAACARSLGPHCSDSDPSIWFIRGLAVDVAVNVESEDHQIGSVWAAQLTRSLAHQMNRGEDGAEMLRFPSRAAFLAQFLRDLADGVAWSKWYYDIFEGLRALPMNAALCEALCREPVAGESALRQLIDDGQIEKVLRTLSEADCRTVLRAFCGHERNGEPAPDPTELLRTAWRAWQDLMRNVPPSARPNRTALELYLALRRDGLESSSALPQILRAFLMLVGWTASTQVGPVLAALQHEDNAALFQLVRDDDPDAVAALLRCNRGSILEIAEQLLQSTRSSASGKTPSKEQKQFTPYGGVFYLLPHLAQLGLEECAAVLPNMDETTPEALVRFLVLLKCLGAPRAPSAFFDPVLRELAGVLPDLNVDTLRAWARSVTPEMAREFQTRWASSCQERGLIGGRWSCLRSARRGRLCLLADGERDLYLYVARSAEELVRIAQAEASTSPHLEGFLCDPEMIRILPASVAGRPVRAWNSIEAHAWSSADAALATCLERAPSPDRELNYFNLPSLLHGARTLDLALTLGARAAFRHFAWRLPGFAWSSAEYLYRNFLDITAIIEPNSNRSLIRLGRPPLHVVLRMIGADQNSAAISWLEESQLQSVAVVP